MLVMAWKPTTALSRAGVARNTVKLLPGAPATAAVVGRPVSGQEYNQKSLQWECARRDAGAQAGHDQTYEAGSQAADTTSDGTHTEPPPPIMPSPQRATPSCHASGGSIAQPGLAGHGGVATNSAKLAAFPASSVIPPQWRVSGRRLIGESAGDTAGA